MLRDLIYNTQNMDAGIVYNRIYYHLFLRLCHHPAPEADCHLGIFKKICGFFKFICKIQQQLIKGDFIIQYDNKPIFIAFYDYRIPVHTVCLQTH
jgi:hypothetical protein